MNPLALISQQGNNTGTPQQQRNQWVQMVGFLIITMLILLDESYRASSRNSSGSIRAVINEPKSYTHNNEEALIVKDMNRLVSIKRSLGTEIYGFNASGIYLGTWTDLSALRFANKTSFGKGRAAVQLKSVEISEIEGINFVYGIITLFQVDKYADIVYPLQGMYVQPTGELALFTTPFKSQKLFLRSVTNENNNNLKTSDSSLSSPVISNSSSARRVLSSAVEGSMSAADGSSGMLHHAISSMYEVALMKLQNSVVLWNYLLDSIASIVAFSMGASSMVESVATSQSQGFPTLDEYLLNADKWSESDSQKVVHRRLSSAGVDSSTLVYRSHIGFELLVVDAAAGSAADTHSMLAFGADKLPATFQKMQGDQVKLNGQQIDGIHFHTISKRGSINSLDEDIFLPSCPMVAGLQSEPISHVLQGNNEQKGKYVSFVEGSLESKICGRSFNISIASIESERALIETKVSEYSGIMTSLCILQIALLIIQMRYSASPAGSSKISMLSMFSNSIIDAIFCVSHMILSAAISKALNYSYIIIVSFLQLILFGVLEMRVLMKILVARQNNTVGSSDLRRRLASLNLRFFVTFFFLTMFFFNFLDRPMLLVFVFYSMWLPQIAHNAYHGTCRAFHPYFLIGTSICRLFVPLYFLGCPKNFLVYLIRSDRYVLKSKAACVVLVIWSVLQVAVLLLQDKLGPRFFVPKSMLPQRYDYCRPWTQRQSSDSGSQDVESGNLPECIICYNGIENVPGGYMLTPCDHVFHKECLSQWMNVKLECPVCRAALPSVDDEFSTES